MASTPPSDPPPSASEPPEPVVEPPGDPAPSAPEPLEPVAPPSDPSPLASEPDAASPEVSDGGDTSLQDLLDVGHRLSVSQALLLGLEAARALMRRHREEAAHGSVQAFNLVFDADGRVRLADPDSARPPGVSPEAETARDPADPADDIRDLGLVIRLAVTGAETAALDETPGDEALGPLRDVVAKAVSPSLEDRPGAADLVRDLIRTAEVLPRPDPFPLIESGPADSDHDPERVPPEPLLGSASARSEPLLDPAPDLPEHGPDLVAPMPPEYVPDPVTGTPEPLPDSDPGSTPEPDLDSPPPAYDPVPIMAPPAPRPAIPLDDAPRRRWPGILLAVAVVAAAGYGAVFAWRSTVTELDAVPDLEGRDRADAVAEVLALGWTPEVIQVRQPGTDPEEVVRTEPEAGAELAPGLPLRLFVSLGEPLVAVPDVAGLSPEAAAVALEDSGFTVSGEIPVPHSAHPPGTVVGTDLRSWVTELEPGAEIGLLVSTGPADSAG